jgi:hypothetical protein
VTPPIPASLAGACPKGGQRYAVHVPAGTGGGRVHVGVGVDPEHLQRTATAVAATEPAAPLWSPHKTAGVAPVSNAAAQVRYNWRQTRSMSRAYFCPGDRPDGFPVREAADRLGRSRRSPARRVGRQCERFSGPMGPSQSRAVPLRDPAARRLGQSWAWRPWECLGDRLAAVAASVRQCP